LLRGRVAASEVCTNHSCQVPGTVFRNSWEVAAQRDGLSSFVLFLQRSTLFTVPEGHVHMRMFDVFPRIPCVLLELVLLGFSAYP